MKDFKRPSDKIFQTAAKEETIGKALAMIIESKPEEILPPLMSLVLAIIEYIDSDLNFSNESKKRATRSSKSKVKTKIKLSKKEKKYKK